MTRRERIRAQTRAEAKAAALRQLAAAGPQSLSLNAIGKELGMSGPALYRYFAGRDELLTELISDSYHDLADAIDTAAKQSAEKSPTDQVRAIAWAYRAWAIDQPHRYLLLFGPRLPGFTAPGHIVEAATRSLLLTLRPLVALCPSPTVPKLERQLATGLSDRVAGHQWTGAALRLAVAGWTRLHGFVILEVQGHFDAMAFDPEVLFETEVEELIRLATDRTGAEDKLPSHSALP